MQKLLWSVVLLGILGSGASGCLYVTAAPSVKGKAWITHSFMGKPFGHDSYWNCDATAGDPVCYEVEKLPAGGAK